MGVTTSAVLASDVRNYIAEKTLSVATKIMRFYQFGVKADLPPQNGTTFTATRYNRLNLPQNTLTEGTAGTPQTMAISQVAATASQWGDFVTITDVAELTIAHRPLQKAIDLLGKQAAETIDREIQKTLWAGTNVYYGSAADDTAGRTAVATNAVTSETSIKTIVANLRNNGAEGMEPPSEGMDDPMLGDLYVGIIDPFVEMDISTFSNWITANQYAKAKRLWNGEAGTIHGVRFVRSNHIPTLVSQAAVAGTEVANTAGFATADAATSGLYTVVTGTRVDTGVETLIAQPDLASFTTSLTSGYAVDLTMPAGTEYLYNVYVSAIKTDGTLASASDAVLHTANLTPGATIQIASAGTGTTVPALLAAAGSKIHTSYFIGKEAYTVVNLQRLRSYLTPSGESESDPLAQRRHAGWKTMFGSVINNQNFMARYEAEANHD